MGLEGYEEEFTTGQVNRARKQLGMIASSGGMVVRVEPELVTSKESAFGISAVQAELAPPSIVEISPETRAQMRVTRNGDVCMVDIDWGEPISAEKRAAVLARNYPGSFNGDPSSLHDISWMTRASRRETVVEDTLLVAGLAARTAIEKSDLDQDDIVAVAFGGDLPPRELVSDTDRPFLFIEKILEEAHVDPDVKKLVHYGACNAGYRALQMVAEQAATGEIPDGYVLVEALGTGTNEVLRHEDGASHFWGERVDLFSAATFHNGAFATVLEVKDGLIVGLPYLEGEYHVIPDIEANLGTVTTYDTLLDTVNGGCPDDIRGLIQDDRNVLEMLRMPDPRGMIVNMDARRTAAMFKQIVTERLIPYIFRLRETGIEPDHLVLHPASVAVYSAIMAEMLKYRIGIPASMLESRNSSAPSTMKNMARLLPHLEDGQKVLICSFGAGSGVSLGLHGFYL